MAMAKSKEKSEMQQMASGCMWEMAQGIDMEKMQQSKTGGKKLEANRPEAPPVELPMEKAAKEWVQTMRPQKQPTRRRQAEAAVVGDAGGDKNR